MKIDEIEKIVLSSAVFPKEDAERIFKISTKINVIDDLDLYLFKESNQRALTLVDKQKEVAAFASFIVRENQVWQEAGVRSYPPYQGQKLIGKLYKFIKEKLHKSLQSDRQHTDAAEYLWTKTLPGIGLHPMIYDTQTGYIIDPNNNTQNIDIYPDKSSTSPAELWRYTWIIERGDYYRETDMLKEFNILMPWRGLWYDGPITNEEKIIRLLK